LYGDYASWNGNIQEDLEGRWLKWKDTEAYVQYALAHGYVPPGVEDSTPKLREAMVDSKYEEQLQTELFDTTIDSALPEEVDLVEGLAYIPDTEV
jgi:hypothetical protein